MSTMAQVERDVVNQKSFKKLEVLDKSWKGELDASDYLFWFSRGGEREYMKCFGNHHGCPRPAIVFDRTLTQFLIMRGMLSPT